MRRRTVLGAGLSALWAGGIAPPLRAARAENLDVIVIGAGLSGLAAALALEAEGKRVQVLEARRRVGGRLSTYEVDGHRFEVGGVEVGGSYGRLRTLAHRFGVGFDDPAANRPAPAGAPQAPPSTLNLGGVNLLAAEWANSPLNPLQGRERALPPPALLAAALASDEGLPDALRWLEPEFAALDVSLADRFAQRAWSREAIAYMDVAGNYSALAKTSALDALRRDGLRRRSDQKSERIRGGSQRLPEAMAAGLATPVRTSADVRRVEQTRSGVEVSCSDGTRLRARRALVTVPAPALARIAFEPALPPDLAEAAAMRLYTAVTTVHFRVRRPYWESDGLPVTMWCDGALERVFGLPGADGRIDRITVWLNGAGAERVDRLERAEIARWVELELKRLRPASAGALSLLGVKSWGRDPLARGAYAEIAAGRVASTAAAVTRPHGRVHFAGEHTEFREMGMEAAVASGQRAAVEML